MCYQMTVAQTVNHIKHYLQPYNETLQMEPNKCSIKKTSYNLGIITILV